MSHHHHHSGRNLKLAFWLNLFFTIFEFIGGLYVNSVAIISDAIHDLGDSLSLGLSWYLDHKSKQGANRTFSFGYARFSLLGALINSLVLITGSVFVIREAVQRLFEPELSDATGMLIFALIGVAVNGYAAWKLSSGKSMNERVVSWHLLEDVLGWVAVLVVAIILKFYQTPYLDPALSLFITAYILWNVVRRLRETLMLFLQGAPKEVNLKALEDQLMAVPNVGSLHHTHIWSLDGEQHVFSTHVKLKEIEGLATLLEIKNRMKAALKPYGFAHYTIEIELSAEDCGLE
ncbi:MAG: cation diffusion facilitator family transporter [Phaeodactylibacter sp.]|uniref:cation diffusion facilitator family transporter n=1 Tax=Phaeodactylibacter sp. TaxID=1940289 RepID=UPI0032EB86CA